MDYTNKLHIIYGDAALGVQTKNFNIFLVMKKADLNP